MRKQTTLESITSTLHKYISPAIYCHPANFDILKKEVAPPPYSWNYKTDKLWGIEIFQDVHLPRYIKKWECPASPFTEYDERDELWAVPLGFGQYVDSKDLAFFVIEKMPMFSYNLYNPIFTKPGKSILNCF